MCGINGLIYKGDLSSQEKLRSVLTKMNQLIHHRGPDGPGCDGQGLGQQAEAGTV